MDATIATATQAAKTSLDKLIEACGNTPQATALRTCHDVIVALEADVAQLQHDLADRKIVERAKGLIQDSLHITEQDAHRRLQKMASFYNLKSADAAAQVITVLSVVAVPPDEVKPRSGSRP